MKKLSMLAFVLALLVSFSACENGNIADDSDPNETTSNDITEEVSNDDDSDQFNEVIEEEIIEEEVIEEIIEEEQLPEEQPLEKTELGQPTQTLSPIQFMSEKEAAEITGGKLVYMPEYNFMVGSSSEYKAYLTPSGKLVYMTDFIFSRLDGASDFDVTWGYKDLNELSIRTDFNRAEEGTVSVSAILSDETAVKYSLYLDQWDGEPLPGLEGVICYAKVSSGTVFFDIGLTIDDPEFADYDVTYTFTGNPYYELQTLTAKVGQTVYIEDIYRIYPFDSNVEWQINAEIKDPDGNTVYTEDFTAYESYNPLDNTFFITKGEQAVQ